MNRKPLPTTSRLHFRPWFCEILVGVLIVFGTQAEATTRTWTGAGANALASTPQNWSDNTPPVAGDVVE